MNKKHLIGYTATAVVFLGIGAAAGGDQEAPASAVSASGSSTTGAVPATTVTITPPAVTTTVTARSTKTVTAGPPKPAVAMAGDGTYEVGVDVKPGTYVSSAPDSGTCYWERSNGKDGVGGIIENGLSAGRVVVTIKKSDRFFTSTGCSDWTTR